MIQSVTWAPFVLYLLIWIFSEDTKRVRGFDKQDFAQAMVEGESTVIRRNQRCMPSGDKAHTDYT